METSCIFAVISAKLELHYRRKIVFPLIVPYFARSIGYLFLGMLPKYTLPEFGSYTPNTPFLPSFRNSLGSPNKAGTTFTVPVEVKPTRFPAVIDPVATKSVGPPPAASPHVGAAPEPPDVRTCPDVP